MTSTKRLYLAPDAPMPYKDDHYFIMDKVGSESAVKVLVKDFINDNVILAGGNVATKASGVSAAGQKTLTVDSTTGFIVGAYVTYLLNGTTLEGNTIASINAGVSLVLGTNIGATPAGGVLDDSYISMISISEYQAANAIHHGSTDLTLPQTIDILGDNAFRADAYPSLTDLFAAVASAGGGVVAFAAGKTYTPDALAGGVTIPSNTTILGNGAKIHVDLDLANDSSDYRAFYIADGSHDIDISGLEFYGDNDPFSRAANADHAAIHMPGVGSTTKDVHVHHCTFKNLFGFTVHLAGSGERVHVTHCSMIECANGLNVNAEYSMQSDNILSYCEAIECSGAYSVIANNIVLHALVGVSLGGTTASGDTVIGQVVTGNVISDTVSGVGISINDGCEDTRVDGNVLVRTYGSGIAITGAGDNPIKNISVTNNTLRSCGADAAPTHIGIYAGGTGVDDLVIAGNLIHNNTDDASHETTYGITLDAVSGTYIHSNVVVATSKNISLNGTSNVRLGKNECDTSKNEYINGATFTSGGVEFANIGGNYTVKGYEELVYLWGAAATHAITLPAAAAFPKFKRITFKDIQGVAGTYATTITPNGSEKIDGAATATITTNYGKLTIYSDGANWFTV